MKIKISIENSNITNTSAALATVLYSEITGAITLSQTYFYNNYGTLEFFNDTNIFEPSLMVFAASGISITFQNCELINGNVIKMKETNTIIVRNCKIYNFSNYNYNNGGGFISVTQTNTIVIRDAFFINCHAINGNGGVIYAGNSTFISIQHTLFQQNSALHNGGIIYALETNIEIDQSNFTSNIAFNQNGGIICMLGLQESQEYATAAIYITDSIFEKNIVYNGSGGVIYTEQGNLEIWQSFFIKNQAAMNGGSIFVFNTAKTLQNNIERSQFLGNQANVNGGAIYSKYTNIYICITINLLLILQKIMELYTTKMDIFTWIL